MSVIHNENRTINMKNTRLIYFATIFLSVLLQSSCGTVKSTTEKKSSPCFEVEFVPNSQNMYEGNVIVQVFDSEGQQLNDAKVFIYSDGEEIAEMELIESSMGVFYKENKTITIKVSKPDYNDCNTELVTMSADNACFVKVRLEKK